MFGCCCVRTLTEEEYVPIIDVQKILDDHVWTLYVEKLNPVQRLCLNRDACDVDVPINYFHFETLKQKVDSRTRPETGKDGHIFDQKKQQQQQQQVKKKKEKKTPNTDSNTCEIATDFLNNTDLEQTYKFRLEKTRRASLSVNVQTGFTIGGKAQVSVGLPKLASDSKAGGEMDFRINVTQSKGDVAEEVVLLETNSDIRVDKKSKFVAKVLLSETQVSYDFRVWSRMTMPTGGAPVSVVRKRDKKVLYSSVLKNLSKVFEPFKEQVKIEEIPSDQKTANYAVTIVTKGIIEGVRLSDQRIVLESTKLPGYPHETSGANPQLSREGGAISSDGKEQTLINVDYVPHPAAAVYHLTSSAHSAHHAPRHQQSGIEGPIVEEVSEEEHEEEEEEEVNNVAVNNEEEDEAEEGEGKGRDEVVVRVPSPRVLTPVGKGPPSSMGKIPSIVTTAPSSVGSSPMSEKASSETSEVKTITTV